MKKSPIKKLSLAKDTVASLLSADLEKAILGGGGPRLVAVSENWENTTCL